MNDVASPTSVKSATRTLDIIEFVVARDRPLVAQEIAAGLAIPVSSLSYLLGTLVDRGYLSRDGRRYRAGPGLVRLQAPQRSFNLAERVAPLVRTLRTKLDETTSFFIRKGWEIEALVTESSHQALRYAVQIGSVAPMHAFASGKAILAAMREEDVDDYLASTVREAFTDGTITAAPALRAELATIREAGVARTCEEHTPGILGLGRVAMMRGEIVGAFGVAIPLVRADEALQRRAIALLIRATDVLRED